MVHFYSSFCAGWNDLKYFIWKTHIELLLSTHKHIHSFSQDSYNWNQNIWLKTVNIKHVSRVCIGRRGENVNSERAVMIYSLVFWPKPNQPAVFGRLRLERWEFRFSFWRELDAYEHNLHQWYEACARAHLFGHWNAPDYIWFSFGRDLRASAIRRIQKSNERETTRGNAVIKRDGRKRFIHTTILYVHNRAIKSKIGKNFVSSEVVFSWFVSLFSYSSAFTRSHCISHSCFQQ